MKPHEETSKNMGPQDCQNKNVEKLRKWETNGQYITRLADRTIRKYMESDRLPLLLIDSVAQSVPHAKEASVRIAFTSVSHGGLMPCVYTYPEPIFEEDV